jgi:hypothetical protein
MQAFQEEYNSSIKNGTWHLIPLPRGCITINCKWIKKIKSGYDGVAERYKNRFLAIGSRQK